MPVVSPLPRLSRSFQPLIPFALWVVALTAASIVLLHWRTSAVSAGNDIPFENDSFYHAHRIEAAAAPGGALPEFDTRIHVPEGSAIHWPWAYDWTLAQLLRLGQVFAPSAAPMSVLAWYGPLLMAFNLALILMIGARLGLRRSLQALALFTAALCPQILFRHAFGMLDHHGAELTATLLAIWSGLRWNDAPSRASAALHGAVLGLALGVHSGLFLLQAVSLGVLGWQWLSGARMLAPTTPAYVVGLMAATLAMVLPSLPFQEGRMEYYSLSQFHLLAAGACATMAIAMARFPRSRASLPLLAVLGLALLGLLWQQARSGMAFVQGDVEGLATIGETISAWRSIQTLGLREFIGYNTLPALIAPLSLLALLWADWLGPKRAWLVGFAALGSLLFAFQSRFWTYGLVPAILCSAVAVETALRRANQPAPMEWLVAALSLGLFLVCTPAALVQRPPLGGSHWYAQMQPVIAALQRACHDDPGVLLADANFGHFITYHTRCDVIANNFILTDQQLRKRREVEDWFQLGANEFRERDDAPRLILVNVTPGLVRHFSRTGVDLRAREPRRLVRDLLSGTPDGFELLAESQLARGSRRITTIRLMRLSDPTQSAPELDRAMR